MFERVIEKISRHEGVDATKVTPPLNEAIDCDALNSLFSDMDDERDRNSLKVEFVYQGYRVLVTDETVRLKAAK